MTSNFPDLPIDQKLAIRELVKNAPPLTERQRANAERLFRCAQAQETDGAA